MKEAEMRVIRDSNFRSIRICMDDGKSYTISYPDFARVAEGSVLLGSDSGHSPGGMTFVVCYFDHISRIEQMKGKAKAA